MEKTFLSQISTLNKNGHFKIEGETITGDIVASVQPRRNKLKVPKGFYIDTASDGKLCITNRFRDPDVKAFSYIFVVTPTVSEEPLHTDEEKEPAPKKPKVVRPKMPQAPKTYEHKRTAPQPKAPPAPKESPLPVSENPWQNGLFKAFGCKTIEEYNQMTARQRVEEEKIRKRLANDTMGLWPRFVDWLVGDAEEEE